MADSIHIPACIALGSNIEPRLVHVEAAIAALRNHPAVRVQAVSSWHETVPVRLSQVEPTSPQTSLYLNGACRIETTLSPIQLLNLCLDIERSRGRDRAKEGRWGSRTLDLDLLLYGDQMITQPGLTVPHPRMLDRLFVLEPLAEIAGDLPIPGTNQAVRVHLDTLRQRTSSM